jgi:hypothetical protein
MSCDTTRINNIEYQLKNNPDSLSNNDLFYYLYCNTKNKKITYDNLDEMKQYLYNINISYFYENIFVNTSNYSQILVSIICLLIPFYYSYPKYYTLGTLGMFIGFIGLITLYIKVNELYGFFFKNIGIYFLIASLVFYILFFIYFNKLNHISLFFISVVVTYLIVTYILKIILTIPTDNNPYNKFRAKINDNKDYTPYNLLIETCCLQVIKRYDLRLPAGNMLYSYLSIFDLNNSTDKYSDFLSNMGSPFISLIILWLLKRFLTSLSFNIPGIGNNIDFFPIVGENANSFKYMTCQANYILPKELNCDLLVNDYIEKYKFNNDIYGNIYKAFIRISNELLTKYSPKFVSITETPQTILNNLKENNVFTQIHDIIKLYDNKSNTTFFNKKYGLNYFDQIKDYLKNNYDIPYSEKLKAYSLLQYINNVLLIENSINKNYQDDINLAIEDLLYDEKLEPNARNLFKGIIDKYVNSMTKTINNFILYGYEDNIISYSFVSDKIKKVGNNIFKYLIGFISCFFIFTKPIGSSWIFAKYLLIPKYGFKDIIEHMNSNFFIEKYFNLGFDTAYFKDLYEKMNKINNSTGELTIVKTIIEYLVTGFVFIFTFGIIYLYNTCNFAYGFSPVWYNTIYQFIFMINIILNIVCHQNKGSYAKYNGIFFGILFLILIGVVIYSFFT